MNSRSLKIIPNRFNRKKHISKYLIVALKGTREKETVINAVFKKRQSAKEQSVLQQTSQQL